MENIKKIIKSKEINSRDLSKIAGFVSKQDVPKSYSAEILNLIVKSKKSNMETIKWVLDAIQKSSTTIKGTSTVLENILKSNKSDKGTLSELVQYTIHNSEAPITLTKRVMKLMNK